MKRLTLQWWITLLTLLTALMLCACTAPAEAPMQLPAAELVLEEASEKAPPEPDLPEKPGETAEPVEPEAPDDGLYHGGDVKQYLRGHLPGMDGSTSLIALEAGLRAAIFDISLAEAEQQVVHSTTWDAFRNLLKGSNSLIFSVPLSQQQYDMAAEAGVELVCEPVAKEGFVFVVNADNPVDSLTQEQLRAIYSGKITNWSELGGSDLPITPYQRNTDSGSQNYMIEFMADTPLMDAPTELRPSSMGQLMDVVAVNDHSAGAIGYSVYAYAADMYGNGNEIKFIAVDGVAPDKAAFASGAYPLTGTNYAVFRADEPKNGPVCTLVSWLQSYDGQLACAQAGYVTLEDIGFDYAEMQLSNYAGTGCGGAAPAEPDTYLCRMWQEHTEQWGSYYRDYLKLTLRQLEGSVYSGEVTQLTDKALQDEINAFIAESMLSLSEKRPQFEQFISDCNARMDYGRFAADELLGFGAEQPVYGPQSKDPVSAPAAVRVSAQNGYLSVAVSLCYTDWLFESARHYATNTAVWDLLTGERLSDEQLFCDGVDIAALLNDLVNEYAQQPKNGSGWSDLQEPVKRDFAGLSGSWWHLTADTLYIDAENPFFEHGFRIALDTLPDGMLVSQTARDFSDCLDADGVTVGREFRTGRLATHYEFMHGRALNCEFLDDDACPTARAINGAVREFIRNYYSPEIFAAYFQSLGLDASADDYAFFLYNTFSMTDCGRYVIFSGYPAYANGENGKVIYYPYPSTRIFDAQTGRQLAWTDLLKDGWQQHSNAFVDDLEQPQAGPAALTGYMLMYLYNPAYGSCRDPSVLQMQLLDLNTGTYYILTVEADYVSW